MNSVPVKKRIAFVIPGGIGTGRNNIGVPVLEQIVKLLSNNIDVTVFSLFPINSNYKPDGFRLIDVSHSLALVKYWKVFWIFRRFHGQHQFSTVHGFWAYPSGFLAVLFGKIFRIQSVVSILGGDAISLPAIGYGQLRSAHSRQLVFWTLRHADKMISLTRYMVDNLKHSGFHRKDIQIIPWGIDTSVFTFSERPMSSAVQFLHIGNLNYVKDQETLLKAFKIISDKVPAHLTIIGEGPLEEKLKKLTINLAIADKVKFNPLVPNHQLPKFYHDSDILLHTSLSEGQCEVVTEAISCGVLVCGTSVGLMYDLPECCVTVPVKEYALLAEKVLLLLQSPAKQQMLRDSAYRWAKGHSLQWTVRAMTDCYLA